MPKRRNLSVEERSAVVTLSILTELLRRSLKLVDVCSPEYSQKAGTVADRS